MLNDPEKCFQSLRASIDEADAKYVETSGIRDMAGGVGLWWPQVHESQFRVVEIRHQLVNRPQQLRVGITHDHFSKASKSSLSNCSCDSPNSARIADFEGCACEL